MAKKILIINGHPDKNSFNYNIAESYKIGALKSGAIVEQINIADLKFNPNLESGYRKRTTLEPDLLAAWEKISWAEHLVFIHPLWWGGIPAIMKGFIDRVFLPGMAFRYRENSVMWDKLLTGKSARIFCTMDQPYWYYRFVNGRPAIKQLKKMTLEFCGIKPVKVTAFTMVRNSKEETRKKWLSIVENLGVSQR
ncbi:MAG: NAD(P)H-dependent oxidoreductase [Bacteroidia bacterium]|nr:NAD(P)H-dependent oxidoreductase [Bacteroidia bacterium]